MRPAPDTSARYAGERYNIPPVAKRPPIPTARLTLIRRIAKLLSRQPALEDQIFTWLGDIDDEDAPATMKSFQRWLQRQERSSAVGKLPAVGVGAVARD